MPRRPRLSLPNVPMHVIQRGNNRQACFVITSYSIHYTKLYDEIDKDNLQRIAHGIVMLYEHQRVRVFLRNDRWCRYVSALIYTPRDRLDTTIRKRITGLIRDTLQAESVDFFLTVGESRMALV